MMQNCGGGLVWHVSQKTKHNSHISITDIHQTCDRGTQGIPKINPMPLWYFRSF